MRSLGLLFLVAALSAPIRPAAQETAGKSEPKPEEVVRLWFERWNALDGSDRATDSLLDLYLPGAFHETGPDEKQSGPVRGEGKANIRRLIDKFSKANTEIRFRIRAVSGNEESAEIVHVGTGPWGGFSAAVEFAGAYTTRIDKRRWMVPGAAFFQIEQGKIRGVRLYMSPGERMEVFSR